MQKIPVEYKSLPEAQHPNRSTKFLWYDQSSYLLLLHVQFYGVRYFNVKRKTCLATDWSRQGIGFFLLQKWCDCLEIHPRCCNDGWKLVLAGGRFTKPAESRYSPVAG